jgi:osmotically-inducible protein OsmY
LTPRYATDIVTLRGEVAWSYERDAAERVVRNTMGVTGVSNVITVKPRVKPEQVEQRIANAIQRMANLDASWPTRPARPADRNLDT